MKWEWDYNAIKIEQEKRLADFDIDIWVPDNACEGLQTRDYRRQFEIRSKQMDCENISSESPPPLSWFRIPLTALPSLWMFLPFYLLPSLRPSISLYFPHSLPTPAPQFGFDHFPTPFIPQESEDTIWIPIRWIVLWSSCNDSAATLISDKPTLPEMQNPHYHTHDESVFKSLPAHGF